MSLINKGGRNYWAKKAHVDYAVNDHSNFHPQADQITSIFFFPLEYHLPQRGKSLLKC